MRPVLAVSDTVTMAGQVWTSCVTEAASAGFEAIELSGDALGEWTSPCADHGVRPAVVRSTATGSAGHLASTDPATRAAAVDRVILELERTARAGGTVVTVAPAGGRLADNAPPAGTYPDALQATLESLRDLIRPTERTGVAVAVEAVADGFLLSPVEMRELLDRANWPHLCACLNLSRIAVVGWVADWISTLRHRIGCLRWGDPGGPDERIDEIAAALAEVRYSGPIFCGGDPMRAARKLDRFRTDPAP